MSATQGAAATGARATSGHRVWVSATPWIVTVTTALLLLVGLTFLFPTLSHAGPDTFAFPGFGVVTSIALLLLGLAVSTRQPANPIGWLFLLSALLGGLQVAAGHYARYSLLVAGGPDELANVAAWIDSWVWVPVILPVSTFLFVLFPAGRPMSPAWRWVLIVAAAACVTAVVGIALHPTFANEAPSAFRNPFGVAGVGDLLLALFTGGMVVAVATMGAGVVALLVRLRQVSGVERRQVQWLLASSVLATAGFPLYLAFPTKIVEILIVLGLLSIPTAATIAILRYRLWDIDLIINRALVYLPLTGILAGLYTVVVAVLQRLFVGITGETSEAATILSALVLAALFTPVKNRLQAAVDARFKADPDPSRRLTTFARDVAVGYHLVDPTRLARRLAEEVRAATGASGVAVEARSGGHGVAITVGDAETSIAIAVALEVDGVAVGRVTVAPRANGRPYTSSDVAALRRAAEAVAQALRDAEPAFVDERGRSVSSEMGS